MFVVHQMVNLCISGIVITYLFINVSISTTILYYFYDVAMTNTFFITNFECLLTFETPCI